MKTEGRLQDPKAYELVVKRILRAKLSQDGHTAIEVHHRKRFRGASGQEHEVDLAFEADLVGSKILVLVECKCYRRSVGVDELAEFAYKLRDIGAQKGIVVTTHGFESGAVAIAVREGIALVRAVATKRRAEVNFVARYAGDSVRRPEYVIQSGDGNETRPPRGDKSVYDQRRPKITRTTSPLDATATLLVERSADVDIEFLPELEGFMGDPRHLLKAATFFWRENSLETASIEKLVFTYSMGDALPIGLLTGR